MAGFVIPKTMGAVADLLYETRQKRLDQQKVVDALAEQETALREHIINNLPKTDTGASGKFARVSVIKKIKPSVVDWVKFYAHVKKTGQFDLMQRRLSDAAVAERWDNKKAIPGVDPITVISISLNKI